MTITQVITALPDAPDPAIDPPSVFSQKAAASVLAQKGLPPQLNAFAEQANETASQINLDANVASMAATAATSAASAAIGASDATPWVSDKTYTRNVCVISQVNFQTYRKITIDSASFIDPANDPANWRILAGNGQNGVFVPLTSTVQIDLTKGNYFVVTLSTPSTLSIINCPPGGFAFVVELVVTGGSLTLPSSVRTPNDSVLGLTVGKTHMLVLSTSNGGARFKLSSSLNFNLA